MNLVGLEHPDASRLAAFVSGRLSDTESAEIETHLADCTVCCAVLERMPADSLDGLLQPTHTVADVPNATPWDAAPQPATQAGNPDTEAAPPHCQIPLELADHPRYRVLEPLGAGGMGTVFKAEHRHMERLVALKVINPKLVDSPAAIERFRQEVKLAARLAHPNIVTAYDADQAGGVHFLVMEFVEGQSLAEVVATSGRLPVAQACDYARQTALGLQHACDRGMVHRDIKPHNLMLSPQGQVKILDFGLARFVQETAQGETIANACTEQNTLTEAASAGVFTGSGQIMGSVDYIAPEQSRDAHQADVRSDIYSLGCTLYYLLTGHSPFAGGSIGEKLAAHGKETAKPLSTIRSDLPGGLDRAIGRMMAKGPAQRFQTPVEAAEALAPFACPKTVRRRRLIPLAVAAALLVVAVGVSGYQYAPAVYRFATNQGELAIEVDDKDVEVIVKENGDTIRIIDTKITTEVTLKAGKYVIELTPEDTKKGLRLEAREFTLRRGGRQIVKVHLKSKGPAEPGRPGFVTPWTDVDDWVVEGQEMVQRNDSGATLLFGDPNWTDYDIEAEVKVMGPGSEIGLNFRTTRPGSGFSAAVGAFSNTQHTIIMHRNGPTAIGQVRGRTEKGRWYRLRVQVRGSSFKMHLDGKRLLTAYSEEFPRGCVGLCVNNARARFRNLKVTGPDGKVLFQGVQGILPKAEGAKGGPLTGLQTADSDFRLGDSYAVTAQWEKASAAFRRGLELDPRDHGRWLQAAIAHAAAGDVQGYRRTCREMLHRFGRTNDWLTAENTALSCLLLPDAVSPADFARAQELAKRNVTGTERLWGHRYLLRTKALADYRAGRYAEAVKCLEQFAPTWPSRKHPLDANGGNQDGMVFAILSLTQKRQGQAEAAAVSLGRAKAIVAKEFDPAKGLLPSLDDWRASVIAWLLCREASGLPTGLQTELSRPFPRAKDVAYRDVGAPLQEAVRLLPNHAETRFALGSFHAQWGEWKKAGAEYDRGLELDPTSYERWREAGVVHRAADDVEAYRRTCRKLVQRFGDTDDPAVADRIVITCLLLPDALPAADFDLVQQLAERAVTGTEKHPFYRYFAKTKGLAEYRAGRHAKALKWLERCHEADGGLQDALLLTYRAMARHRLGQTREAAAALARAKALLANMPDPAAGRQPVTDWHSLLYGWLLYREAEALLKKK